MSSGSSSQALPMCDVLWFGLVDYQTAWDLQRSLAAQIAGGARNPTLLLLEHPHTYTVGKRGGMEHLLWDEQELTRREIAVLPVDRGGDITYHGPGQLVGYPLLRLAEPGWQGGHLPQADFVGYIRKLESVLIQTLARYGIPAGQRTGLTGVWVPADVRARCLRCDPATVPQPAKIASIGVKVDARGISQHGFALNVQPDMEYWQGIVACGIQDVVMTSMAELMPEYPSVQAAAETAAEVFGEVFGFEMRWMERENAGL